MAVDPHGRLDEAPFSFQATKDGKVFIYWKGKLVTSLKGERAHRLLTKLAIADTLEAQLLMARVTGNFKRSNER